MTSKHKKPRGGARIGAGRPVTTDLKHRKRLSAYVLHSTFDNINAQKGKSSVGGLLDEKFGDGSKMLVWREGFDAYWVNRRAVNPYEPDTASHADWKAGAYKAYQELEIAAQGEGRES